MKIYISNGIPSRREFLEKHLKERCPDLDQVWETGYQPDDPFVKWLHVCKAPHINIKALSGYVKYVEIFQSIVDTGQVYSMIVNDDVVFKQNWRDTFETTHKHHINIFAMGVNYHISPDSGYTITGNIGGCECVCVSKQFAEFFLSTIDFEQAIDIVMSSMMIHVYKLPLAVTPICQQTSILTYSTCGHSDYKLSWIEYVNKPYKHTGVTYKSLKDEYKNFMTMKNAVDIDFKTRYGIDLDIWNLDYIVKRYAMIFNR
jgi:hypothetical protein